MSGKEKPEKNATNTNRLWYLVTLLVSVAIVLIFARIWFAFLPDAKVSINDQQIDVTIADTSSQRTKGLGGRERLGDREGMLFSFTSESEYCIWMKDMNFSIDVVWLDSAKKVVDITEGVSPETYPRSFCPTEPARYILEMGAGKVMEWQVSVGDQAEF